MYDILRDEYDIQIEFGDIGNIMAYISIGDRIQDIERLVGALAEISRLYSKEEKRFEVDSQMLLPHVPVSPQVHSMPIRSMCQSVMHQDVYQVSLS